MGVVFDTFESEKQLVGPSMRSSVCYSMDIGLKCPRHRLFCLALVKFLAILKLP